MPEYRRILIPGGTYFFTLVSYRRQKILCNDDVRTALSDAISTTRKKFPFTIDAMVLMPDHLHAVLTLPEDDSDYSARWSMIKRLVTQRVSGAVVAPQEYTFHGARGAPYGDGNDQDTGVVGCAARTGFEDIPLDMPQLSASRLKRREGYIWQRRFWEHQVRDQLDLNRCLDYLHWNPVKHGYVKCVADWPYSTFHRFVSEGVYAMDWGGSGVDEIDGFGE